MTIETSKASMTPRPMSVQGGIGRREETRESAANGHDPSSELVETLLHRRKISRDIDHRNSCLMKDSDAPATDDGCTGACWPNCRQGRHRRP